ncbi:uncharacterized protein LOC111295388 [Durio zibethinus]|uniref:Uncharacterized protein LOC111295388 n=1 Tax=Durio zibethinus TaxID=66656 RepID=A0A6P5YVN3_DURZI|nr:uncharacterized protein LOC111295388 [Durio zibethinus]
MDLQEVSVVALEIVLARERQKKRLMEESLRTRQIKLQEKLTERSMLRRKYQDMLAKDVAKNKLVDDFMDFIGAIENNENAQNFDEKAMMKSIEAMMNCDGFDNGDSAGSHGEINDARANDQNLGKETMKAAADGTNGDEGSKADDGPH